MIDTIDTSDVEHDTRSASSNVACLIQSFILKNSYLSFSNSDAVKLGSSLLTSTIRKGSGDDSWVKLFDSSSMTLSPLVCTCMVLYVYCDVFEYTLD